MREGWLSIGLRVARENDCYVFRLDEETCFNLKRSDLEKVIKRLSEQRQSLVHKLHEDGEVFPVSLVNVKQGSPSIPKGLYLSVELNGEAVHTKRIKEQQINGLILELEQLLPGKAYNNDLLRRGVINSLGKKLGRDYGKKGHVFTPYKKVG